MGHTEIKHKLADIVDVLDRDIRTSAEVSSMKWGFNETVKLCRSCIEDIKRLEDVTQSQRRQISTIVTRNIFLETEIDHILRVREHSFFNKLKEFFTGKDQSYEIQ